MHFLQPKKILKTLKKPHQQFLNNAFLDPYRGCEFGCLYCYGIQEETIDAGTGPSPFQVGIKTSCAYCLKNEAPSLAPSLEEQDRRFPSSQQNYSIGVGFATDPYQPCEKQFQLTQLSLEILKEKFCPIQILTKSELVLRDKKILADLSEKGLALVSVSFFTLNNNIAKIFEPRVASPQKRLALIQKLRDAKISCGAMLMPIFPYLTDSKEELENIFYSLRASGALYCVPGILSLDRAAVKKRVFKVLNEKFPRLLAQYEALYDQLGNPALNYCERIEKTLKEFSEKYQIPTVLPVEGFAGKGSLIVRDYL